MLYPSTTIFIGRRNLIAFAAAMFVGLSSQQALSDVSRMIQVFQSWAGANGVPNAAFVVSKDGVEVGTAVWGTGGWTVDTVRPIGSTSKAITAICIQTLIDGGRLALTDTVQQRLPNFTNTIDAAFRANAGRINVEHLLRQTSGFAIDSTQGANFATGAADANPDQWFARRAFNQALATNPGANYNYNNVNYALLGLIINTVTGETYENYCRRTVLAPRGAGDARIAAGNSAMEAFGGWSMSAREYSSFYRQAFDRRTLSTRAKEFMDRVLDNTCTTCAYGLGVVVTAIGYSYGIVPYPIGRGAVSKVPIQLPDIPPYDLFHTGDWSSGSTAPAQFSSIAAYWFSGATAFMVSDRQLGAALNNLGTFLRTPAIDPE